MSDKFKHGEEVEVLQSTKDKSWVRRTYVAYAEQEEQFPHIVKDEYGKLESYEWDDIRRADIRIVAEKIEDDLISEIDTSTEFWYEYQQRTGENLHSCGNSLVINEITDEEFILKKILKEENLRKILLKIVTQKVKEIENE